jgi:hypothetical protein
VLSPPPHELRVKRTTSGPKADFADEKELVDLLKKGPDHKMNRKAFNDAGYSLASAITIAKRDGKRFGYEQRKAQGEVWLK